MSEVQEILDEYCKRCDALGVSYSVEVIVDNCCTVRDKIQEVSGLVKVHVGQDIFHLKMRYVRYPSLQLIISDASNRYLGTLLPAFKDRKAEIATVIVDALLEQTASHSATGLAIYRTASEQVTRLEDFWSEWSHAFLPVGQNVSRLFKQVGTCRFS
jgi:hypothetical protein